VKKPTAVLAVAVILFVSVLHASSDVSLYKHLLDFAASIFETKFWDTLDNYQARTVTMDLNKGASLLYQEKDGLIVDLQNNGVTKADFVKRMDNIDSEIKVLRRVIRKFGDEISKETRLSSNDLSEEANHELGVKQAKVESLRYFDPTNEKDRVVIIKGLSESMCRLKKVEKVSKCMLDSIDAKKLACDAAEVKKDDCI
jgi:hypothetical protein